MRRLRSWAVALATVLALGGISVATPAYADTPPPTVTALNCDSYDLVTTCDVVWTGGEGNISIRWNKDWRYHNPLNELIDYRDRALAQFSCVEGSIYLVHVEVTDALGRTSHKDRSVLCRAGGPVRITGFNCDPGYRKLVCNVFHAGGRSPIRIQWFYNGVQQHQFDDRVLYNRGCTPKKQAVVTVYVRDGDGNLAWVEAICECPDSVTIP